MDATSLLRSSMSTLNYFGSQRPNPSGFCPFYACSTTLPWRSHARFSADFNHTVLKQWRAQYRRFALDIRKDVYETENPSEMFIEQTISGEVILQEFAYVWITDIPPILTDMASDLKGKNVSLQLVSSDQVDPETGVGKMAGEPSYLKWDLLDRPIGRDKKYKTTFKWNTGLGVPGGFVIKNKHSREFFLKSLTLHDIPGKGELQFKCNSWISPYHTSQTDRILFSNKSYLPEETPVGLKKLREKDLVELRGNGTGERKVPDRIYDYALYNDLGNERPVLGGSKDFAYPPTKTDPKYESRVSAPIVNFIPPDERFPYTVFTDFGAHILISVIHVFKAFADQPNAIFAIFNSFLHWIEPEIPETPFETFKGIDQLYVRGLQSPYNSARKLLQKSPYKISKTILKTADDSPLIKFQRPQVYQANTSAWRDDLEFARQMLAGLNPMVIQCLQAFPPSSSLDPNIYGPQESSITDQHIQKFVDGLYVQQAIAGKRLFILDYYDAYMLYAERINKLSDKQINKTYASRTLFFLTDDGVLKPIAIELCLPPSAEQKAVRNVYSPAEEGTEQGALWRLARAHARVNDAGYHQLISHWLRTHASVEPFIIATHRQLSRMHPLYKLLIPHYLDTMDINQAARQVLINAEGIIERNFTPGKYCMDMSSKIYKDWRFNEQGLPADLLKRGMAVEDPTAPNGLRLVIEDYPFALDGLEVWFAMKEWVSDYLSLYYKDDASIRRDKELQSWWSEIVNVGHGDLKNDSSRWYKMKTKHEVIEAMTTIIWLASAHHAAVNFGQYAYGGYMPNLATMSNRLIPDKGSEEYTEMVRNHEGYFLKTISTLLQTTSVLATLEILSKHAKNEVYVGQINRSTPEWTDDNGVAEAFHRFSSRLVQVETNITARNSNPNLKNRLAPAQVPYRLLYPNTTTSDLSKTSGLTGCGVPNSISI